MRAALPVVVLVVGVASAFAQPAPDAQPTPEAPDAQPATTAHQAPAPEVPRLVTASACDSRDAEALRAHLTHASRRASQWNLAWRVTFTAAAVGSTAVAIANPFPELRDGLYVSGGKAAVGALARWILPLTIDVPEPNADTCADLAALRATLAKAAKHERGLFIMGHIGGLAVNLAGAGIIWYRGSLSQALLSVAVGYPVGLLSNYTMPRGSWRLHRERTWTAGVVPHEHGWVVTLGGAF